MTTPYTKLLAGAAALGLFVAAPVLAGNEDHKNNHRFAGDGFEEHACDSEGDFLILEGDSTLWPPNHKYSNYTVIAEDRGDDDSMISVMFTNTHDEYADPEAHTGEMNGAGNTDQDSAPFMGSGTNDDGNAGEPDNTAEADFRIRAERSGRGDGRTYFVDVTGTFDGEPCMHTFEIEVPHDMGNGAENKKVHEPGD